MKSKHAKKTGSAVGTLHTLVVGCFKAYQSVDKAETSDYNAFAALVEAAPLNDAAAVKAIRDDMMATFGEAHKDAAQIRVNILNNARRVAYGGVKDDAPVRGKGHAAMLAILHGVSSIRELRKEMAEAVPAALKGASGGDRKSTEDGKDSKAKGKVKVVTRADAFALVRGALSQLNAFVLPSDVELSAWLAMAEDVLTKAEASTPKAEEPKTKGKGKSK